MLISLALAAAVISAPAASFAATPKAPAAQTVAMAQLRAINASPDAPPLDIYVNGELIARRVTYGTVTGYNMVAPGDVRIQAVRAFRSLSRAEAVIDQTVKLERDKSYTIAASGMMAQIKPILFNDDWVAPGKGKAKLRLVHLSTDAPALDVVATPAGATQSTTLVKNLAYGNASPYVLVNSGDWSFNINATGTQTPLLTLNNKTVPEGQSASVFVIGQVNGRPRFTTVSAVDGTATPSQLRVLHASPDAPEVDVYLDGTRQLSNVKYKTISNYIDVLPGEHQIQIVPAGETPAKGTTLIDTALTVENGKVYAVAAAGMLANIKPIVAVDSDPQPKDGRGLVRVWHLSPDAPAVDVVLPDAKNLPLAKGLSFGDVSTYTDIPAGTVPVAVQVDGKTILTNNLIVPANGALTMYIFGLAKGTPALESVVGRDR